MDTVTLSKTEYEKLKTRGLLWEKFLVGQNEKKTAYEDYSAARVAEFMQEDKVSLSPFPLSKSSHKTSLVTQ